MGLAFLCGQTTSKIVIDSTLSASSTNPVQNSTVKTALDNKLDTTGGTISGRINLNDKIVLSSVSYGPSLPGSGVTGQVFFLRA